MKGTILLLLFIRILFTAEGQISIDNRNLAIQYFNQADTYVSEEKYSEAIPLIESAIGLDSTLRDNYRLMFTASYQSGNYNTGIKYLTKARKEFIGDDELAYYLGRLYQAENNFNSAIVEYSDAINYSKRNGEDEPFVYDYYSSRGVCYLKQNKYEQALEDFNYAIKLDNTKAHIYANRGTTLYLLKRNEEACESWKQASKLGELSVVKYIEKHCQ